MSRTREIMLETARNMYDYVKKNARVPGAMASDRSPNKKLFAELDERINEQEQAYWGRQIAKYSD